MPHGNVQTIWYTHCLGTQSETKMVQKCEVQY